MGAVFSMCPHLFLYPVFVSCFLYPVFCILAGNLLALGHKKRVWIVSRHSKPTLVSN
jgi:hypothetical protein